MHIGWGCSWWIHIGRDWENTGCALDCWGHEDTDSIRLDVVAREQIHYHITKNCICLQNYYGIFNVQLMDIEE